MPEPLEERLSRFTPDGSGLDRDALLFAAGRASARLGRGWMAVATALAACQLLTLGLLWPRTPPAHPAPVTASAPKKTPPPEARPAREPSELLALRDRALASDGDLPDPPVAEPIAPDEPPLRAFAAPPSALVD